MGGEPEWIVKDIPPTGPIAEHEPRIYFGELQGQRADEFERRFAVDALPLRDGGLVLSLHDVTELRRRRGVQPEARRGDYILQEKVTYEPALVAREPAEHGAPARRAAGPGGSALARPPGRVGPEGPRAAGARRADPELRSLEPGDLNTRTGSAS